MEFRPESSGRVAGLGQKFLSEFIKAGRLSGPLVLDPEFKAARGADPGDRRRRYRDGQPCLDFPGCPGDLHQYGLGVFLAGALAMEE